MKRLTKKGEAGYYVPTNRGTVVHTTNPRDWSKGWFTGSVIDRLAEYENVVCGEEGEEVPNTSDYVRLLRLMNAMRRACPSAKILIAAHHGNEMELVQAAEILESACEMDRIPPSVAELDKACRTAAAVLKRVAGCAKDFSALVEMEK